MATEKSYKTLTDLLNEPAGDCMEAIARVAPAIERVANRSGLLDMLIQQQGTAANEAEAGDIVKEFISALLAHCLGDCKDEMLDIIAAINGMTVEELKENYTGWQLVEMVKSIVTDQDFFTSLQSFAA